MNMEEEEKMNIEEEKMNMEKEDKKKKIMKEIELKTEKKVTSEILTGNITNPLQKQNNIDILQKVLFSGASEFEKKMGRGMTYGEMREMFG
jgi:hypothetical protein